MPSTASASPISPPARFSAPVIQLQQSQFGSLAAVMADIQQVGADSVLTLDANHVITITNTPHTSLTASDFHLA